MANRWSKQMFGVRFYRRQWVTGGYDPTDVISWEAGNATRLSVNIQEFFGDCVCRVYFRNKQVLFTSTVIHPWINVLATWVHTKLEHRYDMEVQQLEELDAYGPRSWHE